MHPKFLVAILWLASSGSAFYSWIPKYRCIDFGTCDDAQVEERNTENSIKIAQRPRNNDVPHDIQISRLASHLARKYNRSLDAGLEIATEQPIVTKRSNQFSIDPAVTPTQSYSVGLDQDGTDFSYFVKVYFGSNKTPLYMLLDTGAGTSWIMSNDCTTAACLIHNTYGATNSTTFKTVTPTETFDINYGSGEVSGAYATDTLSFAGLSLSATFGVATNTSSDFTAFPMDGILGLSRTTSNVQNFVQTLVASKELKSNIIGFDLNRAKDGTNNGEVNFGAPDTSKYSGSLSYTTCASDTSLDVQGDWAIAMDNIGFGTQQVGITGKLAYIDTGTSYIFGPPADVKTFHAAVSGSDSSDGVSYTVPCSTTTSATFTFSGVTYEMSAEDWVGPETKGICYSNIYGEAVIPDQWLLGDTFLKNVYTVFDVDEGRIGFAEKSATPGSSSAISSGTSTGGPNSLSTTLPSDSVTTTSSGASANSSSNVAVTGYTSSTPTAVAAKSTGTSDSASSITSSASKPTTDSSSSANLISSPWFPINRSVLAAIGLLCLTILT